MKNIFVFLALTLFVANVSAETSIRTLTGEKAEELMQALFYSGIEVVDTEAGFRLLDPASIFCRGTRDHVYSAGILGNVPVCYKMANRQGDYEFNFDQKLIETVTLVRALEDAGADADAAMGTYYVTAKNIDCEVVIEPRSTKCSFEVNY